MSTTQTAPTPTDEWVGMPYICQTYQVGEYTVRAAVAAGELRAYRIGAKHLRFRVSDVRAWAKPVDVAEAVGE